MDFKNLFSMVIAQKASDLFIKAGVTPSIRVAGKLQPLDGVDGLVVTNEFLQNLFDRILDDRLKKKFQEIGEVDVTYEEPTVGRFRVNIFKQRNQLCFAFRYVAYKIPTLEELNLPLVPFQKLSQTARGLILVTGPAGSGKTTTVASLINYINQTQAKHIITLEDPIEYIFTDNKSIIEQREIGIDTQSFAMALKHCVHQSPDIIVISDIRDYETMEAAINAAETGHLVITTMHTKNACQTIERIINFYPPHQHQFIREQLSFLLEGIVSLRLLPTKDEKGLIPAVEILLPTPTIKDLLYAGKLREIYNALKEGTHYGTCTFNQSLKALCQAERITQEVALAASDNPDELKLELRGISKTTSSIFQLKRPL